MFAKKKTDLKLKYEMDKRGVSGVVVTIILIGITLSAITIVWSIVSNSLNRNLGKSQSCSDLFQKISLNRDYTCFDNLSRELHFSINIGDIMVDKIIIYVTSVQIQENLSWQIHLIQLPMSNLLEEITERMLLFLEKTQEQLMF